MRGPVLLIFAALSLGGCDYVSFGTGGEETANLAASSANGQQAAGAKPGGSGQQQGLTQTADAGVTTSRSLQAFSGNTGGKSPGGGGVTIDPQNLVGNWTDNNDCDQVTEIYSDGTFRAANGNSGNWRLDGDVLTFSAGSGSAAIRLRSADGDTVTAIDANGQPMRSTRC